MHGGGEEGRLKNWRKAGERFVMRGTTILDERGRRDRENDKRGERVREGREMG